MNLGTNKAFQSLICVALRQSVLWLFLPAPAAVHITVRIRSGRIYAASPILTVMCFAWSPDSMSTIRICVATLRVEHPICRNIPNNTHLVLSHPPSLALEYWTCYIYSLFGGSFPFLTDASHPGNLAHRSWSLLVEGKSLITGLRRMEHILFAKRRV